jgi:hypothetical protein
LRACVQRGAHTARYGQTQRAFQDVLRTLESANLLGEGDQGGQRPSWKTDRFKHLISDHKAARVRSGIEEAHSEKKLLLDDIISMISEEADSMALEREDKMRSQKRLIDAGIELCERGVRRQRKLPRTSRGAQGDIEAGDISPPTSKGSNGVVFDDDMQMIKSAEEARTTAEPLLGLPLASRTS